ncbi:MAG: GNAT family N-acetyltransferase [Paracoccaceae bacterium]
MTAIRPARAEDVPTLLRLLTAMAAEEGAKIGSTEASLHAGGFAATPHFHALLAEDETGPLGMILTFPEYSTWRGEMGLFVQDIYVCPAGRGAGLGRALMAAALAHADWSPRFLTLMVARKNAGARAFYASLGLTPRADADQLILQGQGLTALMTR